MKVDGAKGAWAALNVVSKRHGFRDHRHRADNAQQKFGIKARQAYMKIAKARDRKRRTELIEEQTQNFQDWVTLVPFTH